MTSTANTRYNSTNEGGGGGGGAIAARRRRVKRLNNRFCPRDSVSSTFLVARWRIGIYIYARECTPRMHSNRLSSPLLSLGPLYNTRTPIYIYVYVSAKREGRMGHPREKESVFLLTCHRRREREGGGNQHLSPLFSHRARRFVKLIFCVERERELCVVCLYI